MILRQNSNKITTYFCFFAKSNFCTHILQFLLLIYEGDRCRKRKRLNFQACLIVHTTYSCHNQLFPHILSKEHIFLECRWIHDPTIEKDSRINLIYRNLVRNIFSSSEELSDNSKNLYRNRRNDFHVHSSGWLELCRMIIHGMSSNDSQHQFWDQVDRQWIAINIRRYKFYF